MSDNPATNKQEKIAIDARLLSDAIVELNIARRNVAIYPRAHPSVDRSLDRAFEFLNRLFELRPEITLAIAKDTLIIDDYYMDKNNPVYSEFALHLSRLNIAYVTFITGITKEEIYAFHRFIAEKRNDMPVGLIQESFQSLEIIHIKAGFINYEAFAFEEDKIRKETSQIQLWERYIYGLLEGTLQTEVIPEEFREIPPEVLARFINRAAAQDEKMQAYDKVITSYIRRSADRTFSGKDLRRLLDFINGLKPELKKQFLSVTSRHFSDDMDATYRSLKNVSVDEIIELLGTINEQQLSLPDSLKNLLDKLSELSPQGLNVDKPGDSLLIDDIFLSPDIKNLLGKREEESFITERYRKDIQELMACDISKFKTAAANLKDLANTYTDEALETRFNQTLLELIAADIVTEDEYLLFVNMIKDHIEHFIWTGQYLQILKIIQVTARGVRQNRFPQITAEMHGRFHSQEFITDMIQSFRLLGRQMREESWSLCEYYGDQMIPFIMETLVKEESQVVRKYLIGLIKQFGEKAIPEVFKRLGDSRWFVKRNMLYILAELKRDEVIPHVRPYCRHENVKVSAEAIRCLLSLGDSYGIDAVKEALRSESRDYALQAVVLSGMFRINEVVPDLMNLLRKRGFNSSDVFDKIPIVKALGDIGNPSALEGLRALLGSKSILFKGTTEKLKEEIYRTLRYYPSDAIHDFVSAGMRSQNAFIREESNRLYRAITR